MLWDHRCICPVVSGGSCFLKVVHYLELLQSPPPLLRSLSLKQRGVMLTYQSGLSTSESLTLCLLVPLLSRCDFARVPSSQGVTLSMFRLLVPDSVPASQWVIAECVDKWAHNSSFQGLMACCVVVSCLSRKELTASYCLCLLVPQRMIVYETQRCAKLGPGPHACYMLLCHHLCLLKNSVSSQGDLLHCFSNSEIHHYFEKKNKTKPVCYLETWDRSEMVPGCG